MQAAHPGLRVPAKPMAEPGRAAQVWSIVDTLDSIFGTKDHVDLAQECARAILILVYGLLLVRLTGRRVFGNWSALDIVVSIVVGSSLSRALTGSAPLWGTLAAIVVLMALHWALAHLAALRPGLSFLLEGQPIELAAEGKADPRALVRNAVTEADLAEALRQSGIETIEGARKVTLEPSGTITALKSG